MADVLKEALAEYVEEELLSIVNNDDYIIETSAEFDAFITRLFCRQGLKKS